MREIVASDVGGARRTALWRPKPGLRTAWLVEFDGLVAHATSPEQLQVEVAKRARPYPVRTGTSGNER